jgi:hypothetical protein
MSGLLDHHLAQLRESAIADEVIQAREAWSACKVAELERIGYRRNTVTVPALVLPQWGVTGEVVGYQVRPDTAPMIGGRIAKYLSPPGAEVRLDIPPPCRELIGSPQVPLWITEGTKKADSLASRGLTVVGLAGVQMFRTDDWEAIPLDGRRAYVALDSDVMVKRQVDGALRALVAHLRARGAETWPVYLPTDHGKVGVDDFLASGGTVEDLYRLAEEELREPPPEPEPERRTASATITLLWEIERHLRRLVRFPSDHEFTALALFILHTWVQGAAQATPYILVVSPEKRSGKTRVLEAVELVVRKPLRAANISAAGVFQAIEKWGPTLLVDEVDAVFRSKGEQAENLRAVLNAGNRRGDDVIRGSQDGEPQRFGTFCPKVLAGINTGRLPDTIRDRSITLGIERRRPTDEPVADLFPAELAEELEQLRGSLDDWAAENTDRLAGWRRSERIPELHDRAQEAWDCLLAIADLAGGDWPERARQAAVALATGAVDASEEAHGHLLLVALRGMFPSLTPEDIANGLPEPALTSKTICEKLNADEELPFGGYGDGGGIAPRSLAKLLKPYNGIRPEAVWVKDDSPAGGRTLRGYRRDQFAEAWERYTPHTDPSQEAQGPQGPQDPSPGAESDPQGDPQGIRKETSEPGVLADSQPSLADGLADENPDEHWVLADLADKSAKERPLCADPPSESNGRVLREPPCRCPDHRVSDWAVTGATIWTCGVCHPPAALLVDRGLLVRRRAEDGTP